MHNVLTQLNEIPQGTRLCIYGAGEIGVSLFLMLKEQRPDVSLVCFVDGYKEGELYGQRIVKPEALLAAENQHDLLVVSSFAFRESIEQTLLALGINRYLLISPVFNSAQGQKTEPEQADNTLYAFYDRSIAPDGFDIVNFLFLAEIERQRQGCDHLHPVIVPRPTDYFVRKGDQVVYGKSEMGTFRDEDTIAWWERHILLPCCWLMPSCREVSLCGSRREAQLIFEHMASKVFPTDYRVDLPVAGYNWPKVKTAIAECEKLPSIRATQKGLDYVDRWIAEHCEGKKVVSITLREMPVHADRNSNATDWLQFARSLDPEEFCPVILRDTSVAMSKPPATLAGLLVFKEVPWNMELRMAFYERSYINMFTASGPSILAHFNRHTRLLRFFSLREETFECSAAHMEADGIPVGCQLPGSTEFQRSIWEGERFDIISREFKRLHQDIMQATT